MPRLVENVSRPNPDFLGREHEERLIFGITARFVGAVLLASLQLWSAAAASEGSTEARRTYGQSNAQAAQASTQAAPKDGIESLSDLQARVNALVSEPRFALADWGIDVVSLDTGHVLLEHNACKHLVPASNAKLFTAALALDRLGPDYRIETAIYSTRKPDASGTIKGNLIVVGKGDPSFTNAGAEPGSFDALLPLVSVLQAAGVRRVNGNLIGDESYFTGAPFGAGWGWEDLQWSYGAEVSALSIDDNSVDLSVKPGGRPGAPCPAAVQPATDLVKVVNRAITTAPSGAKWLRVYRPVGENTIFVSGRLPMGDQGYHGHVAIHRPAAMFLQLLRRAMASRKIFVSGSERLEDWTDREGSPLDLSKLVLLGTVKSRTIAEIVKDTLKRSQNLYAQLLLLQVGAISAASPASAAGSPLAASAGPAPGAGDAQPVSASDGKTQAAGADDSRLPPTTEEMGLAEMSRFLAELNPCGGDVVLEEGSGLSRRDLVTAAAIVRLLSWMSRHKCADTFRDSLPLAGKDGTLQRRMKSALATSDVRAKTGTLKFINALSGYATTAAGERLAFSLIVNNYSGSEVNGPASADLDTILGLIVSFTGHS